MAEIDYSDLYTLQDKVLDGEELEYRLSSFPLHLLDLLPVIDQEYISEMKSNYAALVVELIRMI